MHKQSDKIESIINNKKIKIIHNNKNYKKNCYYEENKNDANLKKDENNKKK